MSAWNRKIFVYFTKSLSAARNWWCLQWWVFRDTHSRWCVSRGTRNQQCVNRYIYIVAPVVADGCIDVCLVTSAADDLSTGLCPWHPQSVTCVSWHPQSMICAEVHVRGTRSRWSVSRGIRSRWCAHCCVVPRTRTPSPSIWYLEPFLNRNDHDLAWKVRFCRLKLWSVHVFC
jgi:hypothetical protein